MSTPLPLSPSVVAALPSEGQTASAEPANNPLETLQAIYDNRHAIRAAGQARLPCMTDQELHDHLATLSIFDQVDWIHETLNAAFPLSSFPFCAYSRVCSTENLGQTDSRHQEIIQQLSMEDNAFVSSIWYDREPIRNACNAVAAVHRQYNEQNIQTLIVGNRPLPLLQNTPFLYEADIPLAWLVQTPTGSQLAIAAPPEHPHSYVLAPPHFIEDKIQGLQRQIDCLQAIASSLQKK